MVMKIVKSKRDKEIFFREILNPSKPNKALTKALKRYDELTKKITKKVTKK